MRKRWLISICFTLVINPIWAEDLVIGRTYEIIEPNALDEIKGKANARDWQKFAGSSLENSTAYKSAKLPNANHSDKRTHTPFYKVPFDVTDSAGKIIYPKGYQFNPLEFVRLPNRLVVINQEHSQWLKTKIKPQDTVILARGNKDKVQADIKRSVFILTEKLVERLGLRVVPTIIEQEGQVLTIHEYQVNQKGERFEQ